MDAFGFLNVTPHHRAGSAAAAPSASPAGISQNPVPASLSENNSSGPTPAPAPAPAPSLVFEAQRCICLAPVEIYDAQWRPSWCPLHVYHVSCRNKKFPAAETHKYCPWCDHLTWKKGRMLAIEINESARIFPDQANEFSVGLRDLLGITNPNEFLRMYIHQEDIHQSIIDYRLDATILASAGLGAIMWYRYGFCRMADLHPRKLTANLLLHNTDLYPPGVMGYWFEFSEADLAIMHITPQMLLEARFTAYDIRMLGISIHLMIGLGLTPDQLLQFKNEGLVAYSQWRNNLGATESMARALDTNPALQEDYYNYFMTD